MANVIATASSPEKRELCLRLGPDGAVDYRDGNWPKLALEANAGRPFDSILDSQGGHYADKHIPFRPTMDAS